jgi:hypothetical protein
MVLKELNIIINLSIIIITNTSKYMCILNVRAQPDPNGHPSL